METMSILYHLLASPQNALELNRYSAFRNAFYCCAHCLGGDYYFVGCFRPLRQGVKFLLR